MTARRPGARTVAAFAPLLAWFGTRGWTPAPFQRETWARYLAGESGLLHTPTGSGKTLAALGGPLLAALAARAHTPAPRHAPRLLWVTPLRALATDTVRAIHEPLDALGLDWRVALRTGDATARDRRLARAGQADVVVITPESLALLLSYADTAATFHTLDTIVVDEWHELLGSKRGVLLQLSLARLRALAPSVKTWGLSATLGNLTQARDVLLPHVPQAALVAGARPRRITLQTLVPPADGALPWAGQLGLSQLPRVFKRLMAVRTSLLFTNTRAQAELWHRALASIWPEAPATLALHHGSLDPRLRTVAEQGLRDGTVRCVVATSSLDLGVDFPTVDQVLQVGSPKSVARLLQRAGRARHRPGEAGHVIGIPAQALDALEYAAARAAIAQGEIEARTPLRLSLDVLSQHCVTLALGGGFDAPALLAEVRGTHAYADLDDATWQAVLDFIVQGGRALENYPDYRRVVRDEDGRYVVHDRRTATRHRQSIGTIVSEGLLSVRFLRGGTLGSVDEGFIGRLRPGDRFQFAGRLLQLARLEGMVAYVRKARDGTGAVATWQGSRLSISSALGHHMEQLLADPAPDYPEHPALAPLIAWQTQQSALPGPGRLLAESITTRRGQHLCLYPFAGRGVHEGLAALLALRWARHQPNTLTFAVNDYGLMLTAATPVALDAALLRSLLSPAQLREDLHDGVNLGELARRQFREIARIAGLLPPNLPGRAAPTTRQLQTSSGLLYDVLRRFDPEHLLLAQAHREALETQLEASQLQQVLHDLAQRTLLLQQPAALTPLAFGLWAEGQRGQLSTEDWQTRIRRAAEQLQQRQARATVQAQRKQTRAPRHAR